MYSEENKILQKLFLSQIANEFKFHQFKNGKFVIYSPFIFPDTEGHSISLKLTDSGKVRLSDNATTIMRLSYDTPDVENYYKGDKGSIMKQTLELHGINEDDGEFYIEVETKDIANGVLKLYQALIEIYDLSYLD